MFNNVGRKLKAIAGIFAWVGIIASIVLGIVIIDALSFLVGLLVIAIGSLASWISSLGLYAFGELVDNSTIVANQYRESGYEEKAPGFKETFFPNFGANNTAPKSTVYGSSNQSSTAPTKYCPHCGEAVRTSICGMCGQRNNLFDK